MDDIALISRNREEMQKMLKIIEKYCMKYGIKVSEKSVITSCKERKKREKKLEIQNIKLREIDRKEVYKYLGF
jgi:hypothetical protein